MSTRSGAAEPTSSTGGARGDGGDSLAGHLADLARSLEQEDDPQQTLEAIVRSAAETVPGARHASVTVIRGGRDGETVAATGDLSRDVDQAQYETGEGPCLDTLRQRETARLPDLAADQRWPTFSARAAGLGAGSMLSVRLFVRGDDLGALNLLSEERGAFSDTSEHIALLFASHAAVALSNAQRLEHLHRALDTRDLIGQAKGMLVERLGVTADQAFTLLVRASQSRNRKLHEVAAEIVTAGPGGQRARPGSRSTSR